MVAKLVVVMVTCCSGGAGGGIGIAVNTKIPGEHKRQAIQLK